MKEAEGVYVCVCVCVLYSLVKQYQIIQCKTGLIRICCTYLFNAVAQKLSKRVLSNGSWFQYASLHYAPLLILTSNYTIWIGVNAFTVILLMLLDVRKRGNEERKLFAHFGKFPCVKPLLQASQAKRNGLKQVK